MGLLCWISRASRIHLNSSPVVLPCKDPCFLPIDYMCSLLGMHSDSILGILALHLPLVLHYTDFQSPSSFSNIDD